MSQPLIRELAARLKIDEARAAALLRSFVEQLRAHVNGGEEAVVPEFGRFRKVGDQISFEPDPALSTAVNFRYAGLEPIEIESQELPTSLEPSPDLHAPSDEAEDTPVDADERPETAEIETEEELAVEDVSWDDEDVIETDGDEPDMIDPEPRPDEQVAPVPAEEFEGDAEPVGEPEPVDESDDPWADSRRGADDEAGHLTPIIDPKPERPPARRVRHMDDDADQNSKRPKPWLIAVIVVVMAGAAALFVFRPDPIPNEVTFTFNDPPVQEQPGAVAEDQSPDPAAEAADGVDLGELVPDEAAADITDAAPVEQPAPPQEPATPLRGDGIDRSVSRYTLVVGSLQSPSVAEEVADEWRNRGFRTDVFSETANGVTRYRVGIGQFESINAADAARSGEIASQLPEGTWVYRYPARSPE